MLEDSYKAIDLKSGHTVELKKTYDVMRSEITIAARFDDGKKLETKTKDEWIRECRIQEPRLADRLSYLTFEILRRYINDVDADLSYVELAAR